MENSKSKEQTAPKAPLRGLTVNHFHGFIAGMLTAVLLAAASVFAYVSLRGSVRDDENPLEGAVYFETKIYRAFPSCLFEGLGGYPESDFFMTELCLMPEMPSLYGFKRLQGTVDQTIKDETALFSLLMINYGGDCKYTFRFPNLDAQIPLPGLRYFLADSSHKFPPRDYDNRRVYFTDGNIKYIEFSVNELNINAFCGQIILAKNVDPVLIERQILLPCDGRKLEINEGYVLFSLFGSAFGGNGVSNFCLPNLNKTAAPVDGAEYFVVAQGIYPAQS